ncbi:MAG: DUF2325 domain-containing protein [Desulfobacteraceae bacterium]
MNASEQRQVLRKVGIQVKRKSAFEIHEILVSSAEQKGRLSQKMNRLLHRKFARETQALMDLDEKAFMARWKADFRKGQYAGTFWAAATRPGLSMKSRRKIFGTIHMAMHHNAGQSARINRKLAFHEEQTREMCLRAAEAARARKSLQKENTKLRKSQADLSARLETLEAENNTLKKEISTMKEKTRLTEFEEKNAHLREKLTRLSARLRDQDAHILELMEENSRLTEELNHQKALGDRFQEETRELVSTLVSQKDCNANCPSFDLCKRRVLIVGGLTKMESLYRQIVEDRGGIFEYHNGYVKSGSKNLETRLKRADIVLCPVNCNSHAACSLVKNLGKKHKKPVRILANASVTAMAQALARNRGILTSGNQFCQG